MVFRIQEGKVNDVCTCLALLRSIRVIYLTLLLRKCWERDRTAAFTLAKTTTEQREVLDTFVVNSLGAALMKKNFGIKYVDIDVEAKDDTVYFKMPFGEMKQELTRGVDGTP